MALLLLFCSKFLTWQNIHKKQKKGPYDQTETCYSESTESIIIDYIWLNYTETKTCKITFVELHNLMHRTFLCSTVMPKEQAEMGTKKKDKILHQQLLVR